MKIKFYIAAALVVGVMAACSGKAKKSDSHDHSSHEGHNHEAEAVQASTANPVLNNEALNNVYAHYIHLKNNLVASNEAEAKTAAQAVKTALDAMKDPEATKAATASASAADLKALRASFDGLTKQVERLIKKTGVKSGEIYVEFCPMANNDKGGYWLSNSKEIQNPYYGDQMMKCGSVRETLK